MSPRESQAELTGIVERLAKTYPENAGLSARVEPLAESIRGRNRRPLVLLAGSGLLLLLIACANVINLLLAQFLVRSRELAIRIALGATVRRLAQAFFVDGITLSVLGATAGLLFALLLQRGLPAVLQYAGVRSPQPIRLEAPVFLFALATLILTSLVFTVAPTVLAWKIRIAPSVSAGTVLRSALVVGQVALSMTLLLSAGLVLRSFFKVMSVDPGFRTSEVFQFGIGIPEARYNTERKMVAFHQQVLRKLREIPGVEAAALSGSLPLTGTRGTDFEFEGSPIEKRQRPRVVVNVVTPEYFRVLSIPLRGGRSFSDYDHADAPRVVLVNEAFAKAYGSPVGKRIRTSWQNGELNPGGAVSEIVGISGDVRQKSLEIAPLPQIYLCGLQYGIEGGVYSFRSLGGQTSAAQAAVAAVDGKLEQIRVRPMSEFVQQTLADRRTAALLLGLMALAALGLTAVGIYGVIAFIAAQRAPEMSIRMALGAQSWQVTGLIIGQGIRLAAIGILIGAAGSAWAGWLLRAQLYQTEPLDPLSIVAAAALLLATAAVSSLRGAGEAEIRTRS